MLSSWIVNIKEKINCVEVLQGKVNVSGINYEGEDLGMIYPILLNGRYKKNRASVFFL